MKWLGRVCRFYLLNGRFDQINIRGGWLQVQSKIEVHRRLIHQVKLLVDLPLQVGSVRWARLITGEWEREYPHIQTRVHIKERRGTSEPSKMFSVLYMPLVAFLPIRNQLPAFYLRTQNQHKFDIMPFRCSKFRKMIIHPVASVFGTVARVPYDDPYDNPNCE